MSNLPSAKRWVFTYHLKKDGGRLLDFSLVPSVSYAIYQLELSESGRPHYQGYVVFDSRRRPTILGECGLDERTHWEVARGSDDQCIAYCSKEETRLEGPYEYGVRPELPKRGARSDLRKLRDAVQSGATDRDLAGDEYLADYAKFYRFVDRLRIGYAPKRNRFWGMVLFIGPPGLGKSHAAHAFDPEAYQKQPGSDWWDGYQNQKTVVIDEFRGDMPYGRLLQLCDHYPLMAQIKGGQVNLLADTVIITTNKLITEWYNEKIDLGPLYRRIKSVYYATGFGVFRHFDSYQSFLSYVPGFTPEAIPSPKSPQLLGKGFEEFVEGDGTICRSFPSYLITK